MKAVVTLGEVMALFLAEPQVPLADAVRFHRHVAGSEGNVAVGLARLGHPVTLFGRVGADAPGRWVTTTLRGEGVDVSALRTDHDRPTGLLVRDAPTGRPVTVSYHRAGSAGAALRPADVDAALVRAAGMLFVTALTAALSPDARAAVEKAVDIAHAHGVPVVLDPNVRLRLAPAPVWRDLVTQLVPRADTVLAGEEELHDIGLDADWLRAAAPRLVVIKEGVRGARVTDGARWRHAPARAVAAVDPVGAGDAFAAGWISATLRGRSPEQSLTYANTVASCVVAAHGDLPGLPDPATVERLLADPTSTVNR
ncbi:MULTISPECIES: sugar kinase [unclassified Micromonospora]|uniref:sugar kinase n=1 Tax=unclassified Micromonospora TaxID=2617518 RepID=UPI0022C6A888|nr:sugar kinase [Micromonospora sp. AKA38]GHJ15927.1 sugar kinase [Micromonospora sp. AKA38]